MSMLLMLLMLGLFIPSSQAVKCYSCASHSNHDDDNNCENPISSTPSCDGDVCVKTKYKDNNGLFAALYYCTVYKQGGSKHG